MFEGDRPLTVDEFLFCYKSSEINQSLVFYQFTARGKECRLIKSLAMSDRNWKMKFFFVSGFWSGHPIEVGRDPFVPYTRELGNLHLEGMFCFALFVCFLKEFLSFAYNRLTFLSLSLYSCCTTLFKQILP